MKITPNELIAGWNSLDEVVKANPEDDLFTAQAGRVQLQLKNEILYWNSLTVAQRVQIQNDEMTVNFDPIKTVPANYSNDQISVLQPFFKPEIPEKESNMAKLFEAKKQNNEEE